MIVDVHGHTVAPPAVYAYQSMLLGSRGMHGNRPPTIEDGALAAALDPQIDRLDVVGTDVQFTSPRPFAMMHAQQPPRIVEWFTSFVNDIIARQVAMYPERLAGIAGLPQAIGTEPSTWTGELERCIEELGFVGCLVNPDPAEGTGYFPPMGEEFWFPLYEKLEELEVPAIVHPAGCQNERESYSNHFITEESIAILSLIDAGVLDRFPSLKLVFCHGGGSVPYQIGRWRSLRWRKWRPSLDGRGLDRSEPVSLDQAARDAESFDDSLRKLYFDTVLYNKESLELLFKIVGADRCLFGTEMPGTGSSVDPSTGMWLDDLRPVIESIGWLGGDERTQIFSGNAAALFPRAGLADRSGGPS